MTQPTRECKRPSTVPLDPHARTALQRAPACPRCGYDDLRCYDQEVPICEGCGAVLTPDPSPPDWLSQWPRNRRSSLAGIFYKVIRAGTTDPRQVVEEVEAAIHGRLRWGPTTDERQFWYQVVNTIRDDPRAAQSYAATVLAREALPPAEKAQLRSAQAKAAVLESMRAKPVTDAQLWKLRSLGYRGPHPADRAQASETIDCLLQQTEGRL